VKGLESDCEWEWECECECEWGKRMAGEAREREEREGEGGGEGEGEEGVGEMLGMVGRLSRARTISYLEARSKYWSLRLRG
jgi:hypothetical protein